MKAEKDKLQRWHPPCEFEAAVNKCDKAILKSVSGSLEFVLDNLQVKEHEIDGIDGGEGNSQTGMGAASNGAEEAHGESHRIQLWVLATQPSQCRWAQA